MLGNKSIDNLAVLLNSCQFIGEGKFDFTVPPVSYTFIFIRRLKKILGLSCAHFGSL